ncbi:hypothetical protein AABB24_023969, partial [Solanum stoloniferum]
HKQTCLYLSKYRNNMSSTKWMIFNMIYLLSLIIFVSNSVEFLEGRRLLLSKIPPIKASIIDVTVLEDSLALAPSIPQIDDVDDHDDGTVSTSVSISTHDDHDDDNHDDDHDDDNQDDDTVLTPASSPTHDDHNDDNHDD